MEHGRLRAVPRRRQVLWDAATVRLYILVCLRNSQESKNRGGRQCVTASRWDAATVLPCSSKPTGPRMAQPCPTPSSGSVNGLPLRSAQEAGRGAGGGWAAGAGRRAAPDAAATVLSACSGQQALKSFSVQDSAADHDPLLQLDKLIELRKRLAQSSIAASTARCCNVLSSNLIPRAASPLPQPKHPEQKGLAWSRVLMASLGKLWACLRCPEPRQTFP